jgi:hypothetical protein
MSVDHASEAALSYSRAISVMDLSPARKNFLALLQNKKDHDFYLSGLLSSLSIVS